MRNGITDILESLGVVAGQVQALTARRMDLANEIDSAMKAFQNIGVPERMVQKVTKGFYLHGGCRNLYTEEGFSINIHPLEGDLWNPETIDALEVILDNLPRAIDTLVARMHPPNKKKKTLG